MNRPTAVELLEALGEHLERFVQPRLAGADAYQNRVALNLIRILEREWVLGAKIGEQERARLVALLGHDEDLAKLNARLCDMIASGALSAGDPRLLGHLRQTTLAKIAIDNPRYPTYTRRVSGGRPTGDGP
jgi:hypothetical protein